MSYIQTYTGQKFYPFDPKIESISIIDIAHCLSNICRYAGHTKHFYSVAEHCVVMSELFPSFAKIALLHDAAEAYFGDLPRPIKEAIPEFKHYEHKLLAMIFKKFKMEFSGIELSIIEKMDVSLLAHEKHHPFLMKHENKISWGEIDSIQISEYHEFECWNPQEAEYKFLEAFRKHFSPLEINPHVPADYLKYLGKKREDFTCHGCGSQWDCDCAFDGYNTNGDCLAGK